MALPIRDGNQSLTTLSTILISNSHIPAHTVVSFGTQGITDIATAVSGVELGENTLNALKNITVTGGLTDAQLRASAVTIGGSVTVGSIVTHGVTIANSSVTIGGSVTATISGTPSVTFTQASVTFGTAVITGSTSILNFPATQTVTFAQASVTFGTAVITGSTSIIGTPSVTFTQASVTFGIATITGSTSILNFPATQTVTFTQASVTFGTAVITGSTSIIGTPSVTFTQIATHGVTIGAGTSQIGSVTASVSNSVTIGSLPAISGTVTANAGGDFANSIENVNDVGNVTKKIAVQLYDDAGAAIGIGINPLPVNINSQFYNEASSIYAVRSSLAFTDGGDLLDVTDTRPFPVTLIDSSGATFYGTSGTPLNISGTVTLGAGTAQIGSVTASNLTSALAVYGGGNSDISVNIKSVGGQSFGQGQTYVPVVIAEGSLPAGTNQIGSVTANTFAVQGTAVTTSNFTSTTPSTVLANFNAGREVLTIFNEGAGNLHICAGATCTTIAYQVRLFAGDYYEVPNHQTTITHSAVFATAGTARVTQVS